MRPQVYALIAALAIATTSAASAKGVTLVQQADGSVHTYIDVNIRLSGQTLWLRSADRKGVLKIGNGACSFIGAIQRCLPYAVALIQDGKTRQIAILHGTVFLNLSNTAQHLPRSSEELAPRTILALWRTVRGTYVTIKGTIDEVAP
ncbi:MAG: hypothetical protein WA215_00665 [Candidatus Cybelea sp.]|jgi:hypothetical protein